jgi:hypothetical protein
MYHPRVLPNSMGFEVAHAYASLFVVGGGGGDGVDVHGAIAALGGYVFV